MKIRIAARGSSLSLAQVEIVRGLLEPRFEVEVQIVRTTGDGLSSINAVIEGKGIFTKEIDESVLEGRADVGLHSLKDLPAQIAPGLVLAAVPTREDPCDALIAHPHRSFASLPQGARVGTSSPRRRAQLLAARPDLNVSDARGNVDTRIRRLQEGRWDAIVLARAGLARLNRLQEITETFSQGVMLPAIGQGALALVTRQDDPPMRRAVASLDHADSHREVLAERALLVPLGAGCRAPLAARGSLRNGVVFLEAAVFSPSGDRVLREEGFGPAEQAELVGDSVARKLLLRGAESLIGEARQ